jgi:hypothetical protein
MMMSEGDPIAKEIRFVVEGLAREASLYRGVSSNVAKIDMEHAVCLDKPLVLEGEVEMEDILSDKHLVFVRPKSEKAVLIVPRYRDLIYDKVEYFDIYVYANGVWLNSRTAGFSGEGCETPLRVLKRLLKKECERE